jgi:hypothetical protein
MSATRHWHHDDILFDEHTAKKGTLRWNDPLPSLRRNYVRLLSPEGFIEDVWKGNLEAALEGLDQHHDIFTSQRDWDAHAQWKRDRALLDLPCSATKN